MNNPKILLLEDDEIVASTLNHSLQKESFDVTIAKDIKSSKKHIKEKIFDLAILDINLPDGTSFNIAEILKSKNTSILFLSVIDKEEIIVSSFENIKADDYITKPFKLGEFIARVKSILRRRENNLGSVITIENFQIRLYEGKAYIGENTLELTALEYKLILYFAKNKGRILTRDQIFSHIWDVSGNFVEDNTLTVYMKRIRKKTENYLNIETIRGVGYRLS